MIERTTVRLPRDLLRRAKRKAAEEGCTLTALIEDGLRRVLSNEQQKAKRPAGPVAGSMLALSHSRVLTATAKPLPS
jgi:hypothetical protein